MTPADLLSEAQIIQLNPRDLLPSRNNVRSDPGDLAGLAETIREHGILQPLGVTPEGDAYRVVYGNRRRDAAIVVGLDRVPCITVRASDPQEVLLQQVLENLQRLDLNDLDKARAFQRMLGDLATRGLGQGEALEQMARTIGLSSRQIQRYLRLLQLTPAVQRYIANGELGVTQAQHLCDVVPQERQEAVAALVIEESLSAAEIGRLCAALSRNPNIAPETALTALRRGIEVPRIEPHWQEETGQSHAWLEGGGRVADEPSDPWEDPAAEERPDGREQDPYANLEPQTHDGNRVLRIHSLDGFLDQVQRLTQCLQSGDLQRLMESDEGSAVKIKLAARQLHYLSEAVSILAQVES